MSPTGVGAKGTRPNIWQGKHWKTETNKSKGEETRKVVIMGLFPPFLSRRDRNQEAAGSISQFSKEITPTSKSTLRNNILPKQIQSNFQTNKNRAPRYGVYLKTNTRGSFSGRKESFQRETQKYGKRVCTSQTCLHTHTQWNISQPWDRMKSCFLWQRGWS